MNVPERQGGLRGSPPDSLLGALDLVRRAAIDRGVRDPAIEAQAAGLEPERQRDDLKRRLQEYEVELLAGVTGPLERVAELYKARARLVERTEAQAAEQGGLRRGRDDEARKKFRERLRNSLEWGEWSDATVRAMGSLESALVEQAMVPHLRQWLNELREQQEDLAWRYGRPLDGVDLAKLRIRVVDEETQVPQNPFFHESERLKELGRLIGRMPGGSVGIAGPRGSGKTTAIENVRRLLASNDGPEYDVFRVRIDAPVEYVPREFLIHLHEQICTAWLRHNLQLAPVSDDRDSTARGRVARLLATVALPLLMGAAGISLLLRAATTSGIDSSEAALPLVFAIWGAVLAAGLGQVQATRLRQAEERRRALLLTDWYHNPALSPRRTSVRRLYFVALALALLAAVLIEFHAVGVWVWLDLRRLAALLLVAAAIGATGTWAGAAASPYRSTPEVMVLTSIAAGACQAGLLGLPLLFPAEEGWRVSPLLIVGSALLSAACCLLALGLFRPVDYEGADTRLASVRLAQKQLRRIRFQRTQGASATYGVKGTPLALLPASFDAALTLSTSDAEVPLTTPAVTSMTSELLRQIRDENAADAFKVVIGIDELDKLEGDDGARAFLNEIKGLFTVPGVNFLVSVSEDAMASFERRGLAFRDVFDSAFDEILHLPQLTLSETHGLVNLRVEDMPRSFVALAHCLSGGLARDVIRAIDHMTETAAPQDLERVTSAIVHREIRGKWQAVVAAVRPIPLEPQVTNMLKALYRIDRCPGPVPDAGRCLMRENPFEEVYGMDLAAPGDAELAHFRTLQRLGGEYLGFSYFCRTLIQFFDLEPDGRIEDFARAEAADQLDRASLDYLARARQHLGVNPRLAWEQISLFRVEHKLAPRPVSFPDSMLGSQRGVGEDQSKAGAAPPAEGNGHRSGTVPAGI